MALGGASASCTGMSKNKNKTNVKYVVAAHRQDLAQARSSFITGMSCISLFNLSLYATHPPTHFLEYSRLQLARTRHCEKNELKNLSRMTK